MSDPESQTDQVDRRDGHPSGRVVRNLCVAGILLLLIGLAVVRMVSDAGKPVGWEMLRRAAPMNALAAILEAGVGFGAAILVHRVCPLRGMPFAAGLIVLAMALAAMSVPPEALAARANTSSIVLWHIVLWSSFFLLLALGALNAVPAPLYEAAAVDRAGGWFTFRTITWPLVAPLLLLGVIFRLVDFRVTDFAASISAHLLLIGAIATGSALSRRSGR